MLYLSGRWVFCPQVKARRIILVALEDLLLLRLGGTPVPVWHFFQLFFRSRNELLDPRSFHVNGVLPGVRSYNGDTTYPSMGGGLIPLSLWASSFFPFFFLVLASA